VEETKTKRRRRQGSKQLDARSCDDEKTNSHNRHHNYTYVYISQVGIRSMHSSTSTEISNIFSSPLSSLLCCVVLCLCCIMLCRVLFFYAFFQPLPMPDTTIHSIRSVIQDSFLNLYFQQHYHTHHIVSFHSRCLFVFLLWMSLLQS
jgi:hypothetical protein